MTAFSLVMLGKLVFPVVFGSFFFCCCCIITSESIVFSLFLIKLKKYSFIFFRLLRQISTRCSSAKALSFWREERSHSLSDAGIMTD